MDYQDFNKTVKVSNNTFQILDSDENSTKPCKVVFKFLCKIGSFITFIRNFVFNIIFLLLIIAIFAGISFTKHISQSSFLGATPQAPIEKSSFLEIKLDGPISEAPLSDDDYAVLSRQLDEKLNGRTSLDILSIEKAFKSLETETGIKEVLIDLSKLPPISLTLASRIADAVKKVTLKESARVVTYADNYSAAALLIASAADAIIVNPLGGFSFKGLSIQNLYFKDALDKFDIEPLVFRAGEFKSAVEPFTQSSMSDGVKEEYQNLIQRLWQIYNLKLKKNNSQFAKLLALYNSPENYINLLKEADGNEAKLLKRLDLVKYVKTKQEVYDHYIKRYGRQRTNYLEPRRLSLQDYLTLIAQNEITELANIAKENNSKQNSIAVVYGIGNIVDESNEPNAFTPESIKSQLIQIYNDKSIKGVLLYLNSGGGSVTASEAIREQIQRIKQSGKKVYVSVNSMTASGAYWIATAADKVFADDSSITGSIGVFSLGFSAHRLLNNLGVNQDGVTTSELATPYIAKAMPQSQKDVYILNVQSIYKQFLKLVKQSRKKLTTKPYYQFAEGRIFDPISSLNIGFIDEIGNFETALNALKKDVNADNVIHLTPSFDSNITPLKLLFTKVALSFVPDAYAKTLLEYIKDAPIEPNQNNVKVMAITPISGLTL